MTDSVIAGAATRACTIFTHHVVGCVGANERTVQSVVDQDKPAIHSKDCSTRNTRHVVCEHGLANNIEIIVGKDSAQFLNCVAV